MWYVDLQWKADIGCKALGDFITVRKVTEAVSQIYSPSRKHYIQVIKQTPQHGPEVIFAWPYSHGPMTGLQKLKNRPRQTVNDPYHSWL
jgi:hypothetical protein